MCARSLQPAVIKVVFVECDSDSQQRDGGDAIERGKNDDDKKIIADYFQFPHFQLLFHVGRTPRTTSSRQFLHFSSSSRCFSFCFGFGFGCSLVSFAIRLECFRIALAISRRFGRRRMLNSYYENVIVAAVPGASFSRNVEC